MFVDNEWGLKIFFKKLECGIIGKSGWGFYVVNKDKWDLSFYIKYLRG